MGKVIYLKKATGLGRAIDTEFKIHKTGSFTCINIRKIGGQKQKKTKQNN